MWTWNLILPSLFTTPQLPGLPFILCQYATLPRSLSIDRRADWRVSASMHLPRDSTSGIDTRD